MKKITIMEKYPVLTLEIEKKETSYINVDEVIEHLKVKIDAHPVAVYIGVFDHYAHTSSLDVGEIAPNIKDAKNLICCFGKALPKPEMMAVRPRSFGVADMGESFVVSFMQAPNPDANSAMETWVKSIANI
jgi:hypothetical protein